MDVDVLTTQLRGTWKIDLLSAGPQAKSLPTGTPSVDMVKNIRKSRQLYKRQVDEFRPRTVQDQPYSHGR